MSPPHSPQDARTSRGANFNPVIWWMTIAGICTVIILGSVFITLSYRKLSRHQAENPRPLYLGKLETDLKAVNRDGTEVSLGQLKDKIYVVGYQYTDCPSGCLGMAAVMKVLHEKFGARDDFHLVSVSLEPEKDTPEVMNEWVKKHGVDVENWWFLTGEPDRIRKYMNRYFRLFKVQENTDPEVILKKGKYNHDQRLVLIDGDANVRGYYSVMDLTRGVKETGQLVTAIEYVLSEKD